LVVRAANAANVNNVLASMKQVIFESRTKIQVAGLAMRNGVAAIGTNFQVG
jgi:hypothetical protein